jgi:small-conductance mechanosensitive channel
MEGELTTAGANTTYLLVSLVVGASVLSFVLRRIGQMRASTRVRRWIPLLHVATWLSALVAAMFVYAAKLPDYWLGILGLFIFLVGLASVGWMRSVAAGITLAAEGRIRVGDSIKIASVDGEVVSFGLRSVRVRAVDGALHEIPNEMFMIAPVATVSGDGGDSACEITMKIPPTVEPNRAIEIARNAAILTPWASPRHRPEVFLRATDERDETFEITIRGFAFDPTHQDHYRSDVIARFHDDFRRERTRRAGSARNVTTSGLVLSED